ncbi:MAG: hypothetical protein QM492_07050 [Rhodobacterales bacterium]
MGFFAYAGSASIPTGIADGGIAFHVGEYVFGYIRKRQRDNRSKIFNARSWWQKYVTVEFMAANTHAGRFTVFGLNFFNLFLFDCTAKDRDKVRCIMLTKRLYLAMRSPVYFFRFHIGRDDAGSFRIMGLCLEVGCAQK